MLLKRLTRKKKGKKRRKEKQLMAAASLALLCLLSKYKKYKTPINKDYGKHIVSKWFLKTLAFCKLLLIFLDPFFISTFYEDEDIEVLTVKRANNGS